MRRKIPMVAPSAPTLPEPPRDRRKQALARVAGKMGNWRPSREVLRRVRAVPTIFPWLDFVTKVGGLPVGRMTVIHGPSSEGKTVLSLGLGLSFLRKGHFFGYIDAEHSTPISWLEGLFHEYADDPLFVALRPTSYEHVSDAVRELLKSIIAAKESGGVPDAGGIIVVDSLRKLVPEDFLEKIKKHGAQGERGSVDGMSGMGARIKAKMNADWFDELTPLIARADVAFVVIGRESEGDPRANQSWKLSGGKAVLFEGSLMMRVERDWVREGGDPKHATVVGERHDVAVYKSKVAGKVSDVDYFTFFTSNGAVVPEGFDAARDLVELGCQVGAIALSGSWLTFHGRKPPVRWQGRSKAVQRLHADRAMRGELETAIRARFKLVPTEALASNAPPAKKDVRA
jgi:RecA/RadA recombinase